MTTRELLLKVIAIVQEQDDANPKDTLKRVEQQMGDAYPQLQAVTVNEALRSLTLGDIFEIMKKE